MYNSPISNSQTRLYIRITWKLKKVRLSGWWSPVLVFCKSSPGFSNVQPRLETTAPENLCFTPGELIAYPGIPLTPCIKVPLLNSVGALCLVWVTLRYVTAVMVGMLLPMDPYRKRHRRDSSWASVPRRAMVLLNIQFFFILWMLGII